MIDRALAGLIAGIIFGFGLSLSQMVSPAKVQGFLDLAGDWDPSLALVMLGAVLLTFAGYRFVLRRKAALLDRKFHLPKRAEIDVSLIGGAAIFGIGWGLSGLCPGPAIASLGYGSLPAAAFVAAMVAGFALAPIVSRSLGREARG